MENPLPACPATTSCVRTSRRVGAPPDVVFDAALAVLEDDLSASHLHADAAQGRLGAVVSVFLFKDDVAVAVEPDGDGAHLHIRSASRVGRYDFGVNRRRVDHFFEALSARLGSAGS